MRILTQKITSDLNTICICREFFNVSGPVDGIVQRFERINTTEDISAIRGMDVSGQNAEAAITSFSSRSVELVIWSGGDGRGFNYRIQLYNNDNTGGNGAVSTSVSVILLIVSTVVGFVCFKNGS